MNKVIRWGLAGGLAAALGLFVDVHAQSSASGTGSSGSSGSAGARGDTGGPPPTGSSSQSGQTGSSATGTTSPQGGAAGTSSDPGSRATAPGDTGAGATGSSGTTGATGRETTGRQASAGQGKVDKGLQERLEKIHAMNQAEVQMGQLGTQSAQNPEVKQFAEHMQTDHQKADQKLTQTAQSAGAASLEGNTFKKESDKAKKDMEKLQSKTGTDFDKEFMSRMVKDHENALKEVEKAAKDAKKANHTELASLLEQTQQGMKGHLDHAKQVQKSLTGGQRQGRRPEGATGSGAERQGGTGSRGDTGGPPPSGKDTTKQTNPQGGAAGTSSDPGGRTTK